MDTEKGRISYAPRLPASAHLGCLHSIHLRHPLKAEDRDGA